MALVAWCVYEVQPDGSLLPATGLPIGPADMRLVDYITRDLAQLTQPTIVELGGGQYGFVPTAADEARGVAWLVDNGADASPRRESGTVSTGPKDFAVWHLEDDEGELWAGATPTVESYVTINGAGTSPGVVAVRPYLFAVSPTTADLSIGVSFRADSPTGASPPSVTETLRRSVRAATPITVSSPGPEATAAKALRDWLLWNLPDSCVAVNLTRAAVLKATTPGPYVVPAAAELYVSLVGKNDAGVSHALTAGTRSATQLAADCNLVTPGIAGVDADDFFYLTGSMPSFVTDTLVATNSCIAVAPGASNAIFGWDLGGECFITTPVTPPGPQGVADGWPLNRWLNPSQLGKGRVCVTIGGRPSALTKSNPRLSEYDVTLDVGIFRAEPQQQVHQTREGINAALTAVRSVLTTDEGKRLGRGRYGDVMNCIELSTNISPVSFPTLDAEGKSQPGGLFFDSVAVKYLVRVYQTPTP